MEVLSAAYDKSPSYSSGHVSEASSPAVSRRGSDPAGVSALSEIPKEEVNNKVCNKVHVAVGKSVEKENRLLHWTFKNFQGKEVVLLHVYPATNYIPTHLMMLTTVGKLPASQASPEVLSAFRKHKKEQTLKFLQQNYLITCSAAKVNANIVMVEAEKVHKGIVDTVEKHNIRTLVIGAFPGNFARMKMSSSKANYAAKYAPSFCQIWFVKKGKHVWTRDVFQDQSPILPQRVSPQSSYAESSGETPFYNSKSKLVRGSDDHYGSFTTTNSSSTSWYTSSERMTPLGSESSFSDDALHSHLMNSVMELEVSRNQAHADLLKLRQLQLEARGALTKVKELGSSLEEEVKLRKEAEDLLRNTQEEQEKILREREDATEELSRTRKNITAMSSWVREAKSCHDEASGELKHVEDSIAILRHEKQQMLRQKMEALSWVERFKSRGKCGYPKGNGFSGMVDGFPELAEFSLSDLQSATCNFSASLRMGHGGYGSVFKGEMLGTTVAVRRLHMDSAQAEFEFQQEVKVVGKLQHPHIVSLLGVCPEAFSIVYEYLPNGNLHDSLARKSSLFTWKTRVQIITDIASALSFLHSLKPEKVVYGNLTPKKILLDSDLRIKISDFGICFPVSDDDNSRNNELLRLSTRWRAGIQPAFPYTDPEFQRIGILTPKSDVYALGLIILQLLTGKSPVGLVGEVQRAVSSGNLGATVDPSAGEWPGAIVRRLAGVALQCCELNGCDRPDMTPSFVMDLELLHVPEERPVPSFFLCPILQEIMHDPQVAADGFTYEGEAMREWLESGKDTSPMTNLKLSHLNLTPNHAIRLAIQDWMCKST